MKASKRQLRERLMREQNGLCHLCGNPMSIHSNNFPTFDHLVPKSQGGKFVGNVKLAHVKCNHRRADRPIRSTDSASADMTDKS